MHCPKCGSTLRPSKQKKGYFLCDNCRVRMSLNHINKLSASATSTISRPLPDTKPSKKKHFPLFIILFLLLAGTIFIHFNLFDEIETMITPSDPVAPLTKSVELDMIAYEILSDNVTPLPSLEHEYLIVNILLTNNSADTLTVDAVNNFELFVDNAKILYFASSENVLNSLGYSPLNSTLSSGKSIQGYLCFELPVSWKTVDIHYAPEIWSSADLVLTIENTD